MRLPGNSKDSLTPSPWGGSCFWKLDPLRTLSEPLGPQAEDLSVPFGPHGYPQTFPGSAPRGPRESGEAILQIFRKFNPGRSSGPLEVSLGMGQEKSWMRGVAINKPWDISSFQHTFPCEINDASRQFACFTVCVFFVFSIFRFFEKKIGWGALPPRPPP